MGEGEGGVGDSKNVTSSSDAATTPLDAPTAKKLARQLDFTGLPEQQPQLQSQLQLHSQVQVQQQQIVAQVVAAQPQIVTQPPVVVKPLPPPQAASVRVG